MLNIKNYLSPRSFRENYVFVKPHKYSLHTTFTTNRFDIWIILLSLWMY
jgi:hypothetical protein